MLYAVAVLAPLLGSAVTLLLGRQIGDRAAQAVSILLMVLAAVCGVSAFVQLVYQGSETGTVSLGTWVDAGTFHATWALRYDTLSAVMVAMVTTVSTLIHIYSIGYMSHEHWHVAVLQLPVAVHLRHADAGDGRQPAAAVLRLGRRGARQLSADRLLVRSRNRRMTAAMKAFIVNRVGDLASSRSASPLVFFTFGCRSNSPTIFGAVHSAASCATVYHVLFGGTWRAYEVIGILLFIGAMGKSAQIGAACLAAGRDGGSDARYRP